jgi:hypothetical protein
LQFLVAFSLAFIACAAGAEAKVRPYLRSIITILSRQMVAMIACGTIAFMMLADWLPCMQGMSPPEVVAVSLIGATVIVARSPSSAYAIMKEPRAKESFIPTILGVTTLTDGR